MCKVIHRIKSKVRNWHLDLVSEVLVLAANNVQLLIGVIEGGLHAESLSAEVAALGVASVQLSVQIICLRFPFAHNLDNICM